jgi:hypothetical protein
MAVNQQRIRTYIQKFAFEDLFIEELGWDHQRGSLEIRLNGKVLRLTVLAEKRGMVALHCPSIPDKRERGKIEQIVAKTHRENLIVYSDPARTEQVWQWVRREPGKPLANRERSFSKDQTGEKIVQVLSGIAVDLDEEENLTIVDVTSRVRASFDMERVTKRFYDRFKRQHDAFLKFIEGIPDEDFQRWYTSVMMNRLMFIYFVQKKGFLDGDLNYLRNRLAQTDGNFYRDFLCVLFFEGFAKKDHPPAVRRLLGQVPYLNGGLFLEHQIEARYGQAIEIENEAFEKLFDFFDEYNWHLDERPLRNDNEINPDVLGYIFEKYINQKQMGAYYTKEDITEYISKNTIIPFLFDEARKAVPIAFEGDHTIWDLLRENPNRYIYPAVRHGSEYDLPENIAAGLNVVSQRGDWNTPAPSEFALPTEIWREVVARRNRYSEIKGKLERGEVREINDLITLNLDIRQFVQDVIDFTDSPDLIRAFWQALNRITVLDPTCGSGAFLFAALNILEPLYDACLERMEEFVAEEAITPDPSSSRRGEQIHPAHYTDFKQVMARTDQHPNRRYFILKSIIIRNLYGVDIMEEAVEIAKLRLFLKLVSQVDDKNKIEPLPDIDFNIRAGNTLVGFATEKEFTKRLFAQAVLPRLEVLRNTVDAFRQEQLNDTVSHEQMQVLKQSVQRVLGEITDLLDDTLMQDYGQRDLQKFRKTHQPFHWFVEFYGVLKNGGFDVIIGNPPYVEYSEIRNQYRLIGYVTEDAGNLYANTIERSFVVVRSSSGRIGMIVQLPIVCTDRMQPLQEICYANNSKIWFASFDDRPARLFDGLEHIRATIVLSKVTIPNSDNSPIVFSTNYIRWYSETRPTLFQITEFQDVSNHLYKGVIPKIGSSMASQIIRKIDNYLSLGRYLVKSKKHAAMFHNAPQYWVRSMNYAPYFWNERDGHKVSTQMKSVYLETDLDKESVVALLNSSLFYWWFIIMSDCRHLNLREIASFPVNLHLMNQPVKEMLAEIVQRLMQNYQANATRKQAMYKTTGRVEYDEFSPRLSKPIIDEIDRVLAQHYGFTDEELDFIINYDIKYRMGDDLGGDEEE